jgi:hypothetical protein
MFTTKYRYYEPAPAPADCTSGGFTPCERIDGPYAAVSARYEGGYQTVYCDLGDQAPGMTFGPVLTGDTDNEAPRNFPRPTLWVMNAQGATVATYHL